jgi:hypothetical protein
MPIQPDRHQCGAEDRAGFPESKAMSPVSRPVLPISIIVPAGLPERSELVLIAARPSMGKTALALNIAEYAAFHDGRCAAVSSLWKCPSEQLVPTGCFPWSRMSMRRKSVPGDLDGCGVGRSDCKVRGAGSAKAV